MLAALPLCLSGQDGPNAVTARASDPPAAEVRFPVALQHGGAWCYGYLAGNSDRVRFEVVQPQSDKGFSFDSPRAEVSIRQWIILGMPQDAIEVKIKGATYHMRWLANEGEVQNGAARRWAPPVSRSPLALIAAVQNPVAAMGSAGSQADGMRPGLPGSQGRPQAADPSPGGPTATADNTPQDVPSGRLAGVYIATTDYNRPANKQFLFYTDGFVMNGVPQKGMLTFDINHYRPQDNPDHWWVGKYKVEGDTIKIVWQNQFGDPANPAIYGLNEKTAHPAYDATVNTFIPMCHCTGKRLSGMYRWGAPGQDQYIQFFPDGTFLDHRATDELLVISFEHPRIQRGAYQIVDQTIIFNFPDGHRGTLSFLAPRLEQNNPAFDWISFGWHMFFEEGYRAKLSQGW
jgi:hypothetical protein